MFYPDKVQGAAEARRVLRDGGHYLFAVWDCIERNALSHLANESLHAAYPDNPPQFMTRGPYSYHDLDVVEVDLKVGGFSEAVMSTVEKQSRSASASDAARGLVYGSPMGVELADYGEGALDRVFADLADSARRYEGPDGFAAPMAAHIVTATK
jgi:hypothetical protein